MKNQKTSSCPITVQISSLTQNIKLYSVDPKCEQLKIRSDCQILTLISHAYQFRLRSPNVRKIYSDTLELNELILLTDKFQKS